MKKKTSTSKRPTRNAVGSDALVRATLTRAIVGMWTRWEKGTAVKARKQADGYYFIERVKPDGLLYCANKMAGVPRDLLRFSPNTPVCHAETQPQQKHLTPQRR